MKHFPTAGLFFLLSILFVGCLDKIVVEQEKYSIEFGSECGWCAGQEFITITSSIIEYRRNIPCGDNAGIVNKGKELNSEEWEQITSSFDYSLYKTLEYTDCNVCADGCDEIIRISEENSTHELRFSFSDEVEGMQNFRKILSGLMNEMREMK